MNCKTVSRVVFSGSLLAVLLCGVPVFATMERYACTEVRVCDQTGACRNGSGTTNFELEPRQVNRVGEGTYTLRYHDRSLEAYSLSGFGPVIWAEGRNNFQMLSLTGDDTALWQVSDLAAERSVITFLRCEE